MNLDLCPYCTKPFNYKSKHFLTLYIAIQGHMYVALFGVEPCELEQLAQIGLRN